MMIRMMEINMSINEIKYQLLLLSDLHIGSGLGIPGILDKCVVRDSKGFAYAPSSHIKGLVRDSCIRLIDYLGYIKSEDYICAGQVVTLIGDNPSMEEFCVVNGKKRCLVCHLFGSPWAPGTWRFSPAEYMEEYRNTVRLLDEDRTGLAHLDSNSCAQASINPHLRRAEDGHLFNLEVVRSTGMTMDNNNNILWTGRLVKQSMPLLVTGLGEEVADGAILASLLFTRCMGGKRRRGWGRCRFIIDGMEKIVIDDTLDKFLGQSKENALTEEN